jgi:hypothetical protein
MQLAYLSEVFEVTEFNQVLEKIGDRIELHAKFLNTLSLLEYIGARKIFKSQIERTITEELLGHMAEEIRHAQVLKHLALKLSDGHLSTYQDEHLLAPNPGKAYMQIVDHSAQDVLLQKDEWLNYLITTLLVEERASNVYPTYNSFLGKLGYQNKLMSIIRDEDKHLKVVVQRLQETHPNLDERMDQLRSTESAMFYKFMDAVHSEVSLPHSIR